jgi:hypothetical protein
MFQKSQLIHQISQNGVQLVKTAERKLPSIKIDLDE